MDRAARIGRTFRELDRVAVILLALAVLAERAAAAPLPLRALVLWALRRGHGIAAAFVADAGGAAGWVQCPPVPACLRDGSGPAAAMDLAAAFRSLARALAVLVAQLRRQALRLAGRADGAGAGRLPGVPGLGAARAGRADTS